MATAKKPAAGAKKASPAKSAQSKSSSAAGAGRATVRGRGAGATAKSATKTAAKGATKTASKSTASKTAAKSATKSAAKSASKAAAKGATKSAKAPTKSAAGKRGPNPAFMKPLQPDEQLAAIVGSEPMPRTQVVASVWKYIKENGLQESRNINADEKLRPIFGKDQITMFEMMKLVNAHLSDVAA